MFYTIFYRNKERTENLKENANDQNFIRILEGPRQNLVYDYN